MLSGPISSRALPDQAEKANRFVGLLAKIQTRRQRAWVHNLAAENGNAVGFGHLLIVGRHPIARQYLGHCAAMAARMLAYIECRQMKAKDLDLTNQGGRPGRAPCARPCSASNCHELNADRAETRPHCDRHAG